MGHDTPDHLRHRIPLDQQIRCVERELSYRRVVYPRLIANGRLTHATAHRQSLEMQAVLDTLKAARLAATTTAHEQSELWGEDAGL